LRGKHEFGKATCGESSIALCFARRIQLADELHASRRRGGAEEAEHTLHMLDVELKGTPEHATVKNDPKKTLAPAYNIRKGWRPKKIYYNVVINLRGERREARRILCLTFYMHKSLLLEIPERTREKLKEKEVRSSAGAQEVIPPITDDFTRNLVLD
jgi:hypothetical protein